MGTLRIQWDDANSGAKEEDSYTVYIDGVAYTGGSSPPGVQAGTGTRTHDITGLSDGIYEVNLSNTLDGVEKKYDSAGNGIIGILGTPAQADWDAKISALKPYFWLEANRINGTNSAFSEHGAGVDDQPADGDYLSKGGDGSFWRTCGSEVVDGGVADVVFTAGTTGTQALRYLEPSSSTTTNYFGSACSVLDYGTSVYGLNVLGKLVANDDASESWADYGSSYITPAWANTTGLTYYRVFALRDGIHAPTSLYMPQVGPHKYTTKGPGLFWMNHLTGVNADNTRVGFGSSTQFWKMGGSTSLANLARFDPGGGTSYWTKYLYQNQRPTVVKYTRDGEGGDPKIKVFTRWLGSANLSDGSAPPTDWIEHVPLSASYDTYQESPFLDSDHFTSTDNYQQVAMTMAWNSLLTEGQQNLVETYIDNTFAP